LGAREALKAQSEKKGLFQKIKNLRKNGLVTTLFLLLLVLLANFVIQGALTLILKTPTPLHTPISGSMEPTLNIGDLLIIQGGITGESVYAHLGNGDIIIFHDPRDYNGIPIVHRAIDKYQVNGTWYIVTKGDHNGASLYDYENGADDWSWYGFPKGGNYSKAGIPESYIIGKVIFRIPYLGYVLRTFDETTISLGIFAITLRQFLIIILLVVFVYLELSGSDEETKEPPRTEKQEKMEEKA
jgi:signal peptidase I